MKKTCLLVLLILILPVYAFGATKPDIHYIKIDGTTVNANSSITLNDFTLGDTFRVKVMVENNGDDSPAGYNNITVSFEQFISSTDKSRVSLYSKSSDLNYTGYFGTVYEGGPYANFVMVESVSTNEWDGSDGWGAENEDLEVTVKPKAYGDFYIYYRAAMSNQASWSSGWTYSPSSGWYPDCLGYPAYRIKVVLPEPDSTAPGRPGTTDMNNSDDSGYSSTDNITDDSSPRFTWGAAQDNSGGSGIKGYYWAADDSTPESGGNWTTSLSAQPSGLSNGSHYTYVKAVDNNDNVGNYSSLQFTIDMSAPSSPTLLSPYNGSNTSDRTPALDWSSPSGAYRYNVKYETTDWFDEITVSDLSSSQYIIPSDLQYGKTYYWWVQAIDLAGNSSTWTSKWTFKIEETAISLSGKVGSRRWPNDGLEGVSVQTDTGENATTGEKGKYILEDVPSGDRTISVSLSDYWATGTSNFASHNENMTSNKTGLDFTDFACKGTAQVSISVDDADNTVSPGQTFNVTISLENNSTHSVADVRSFLDISFDESQLTVGTPYGDGWDSIDPHPAGSTIWVVDNLGNWTNPPNASKDYLISASRSGSFASNDTYSCTVPLTVKPTATSGTVITLMYRGTIGDHRDPVSTGSDALEDQQGLNIRTHPVVVQVVCEPVIRIEPTTIEFMRTATASSTTAGNVRNAIDAQGVVRGEILSAEESISFPVSILNQFTVGNDSLGEHVSLQGFFLGGSPGAPELPYHDYCFLLPEDVDGDSVEVVLEHPVWEDVPGKYDISPVYPPRTSEISPSLSYFDHLVNDRDLAIYDRDTYYPESPLGQFYPSKYRHWNLGRISLWPVAYNPVQKKIRLLRSGTVHVTFSTVRKSLNSAPDQKLLPRMQENLWRKISPKLENPDARDQYYPSFKSYDLNELQQASDGSDVTANYVIITTEDIVTSSSTLSNFASHKESLGYTVQVITEGSSADNSHYLSGTSANERAINIRGWLKDQGRYLAWGIEYVLIIGNPHPSTFSTSTSVPMFMAYPIYTEKENEPDSFRNSPTDMFYAELSGDWDKDGDTHPGEYQDFGTGGIDADSEIAVGRIPYYGSTTDLDKILQKIIDYENASGDEKWRKKLLIPAAISNHAPQDRNGDGDTNDAEEWSNASLRTFGADWGEAMKTLASNNNFEAYTLYEQIGCYGPNTDWPAYPATSPTASLNIVNLGNEWKKHYGFVTWWGHGSETGVFRRIWKNDDYDPPGTPGAKDYITQHTQETEDEEFWKSNYCNKDRIDDKYPSFVVQVSCHNGRPEDAKNLGYSLLKHGAIATVSASRVSWYNLGSWTTSRRDNTYYGYHIFQLMAESKSRIGDALNDCKSNSARDLLWQSWMNCTDFNLYGDPSATQEILRPSSFTIHNDGQCSLSVTSIAPETSAGWIDWTPKAPFEIAAGELKTVAVSVDFNQVPVEGQTTPGRLLVESTDSNKSPYPEGINIIVNNEEEVSGPGTPSGNTGPLVGVEYIYMTTGATSNLGHMLEYEFDWGDGTVSGWSERLTWKKTWSDVSTKNIIVTARCKIHTNKTSVSTGLLVNPQILNLEPDRNFVTVPEGGTSTFKVKLNAQPFSTVSVTVTWESGDNDITVQSGTVLTFTTSNWENYQTVTLAASEDSDSTNGTAIIRLSASGITDKDITATEVDNGTSFPVIESVTPSSANPGTQIMIDGSNFGASQGTVSFYYELNANIVSWSESQIVCTVPENAQTGCVKVIAAHGTSNCFNFNVPEIYPNIRIEPCPIDFGTGTVGIEKNKTVIVHNDGDAELVITEISILGDNIALFQLPGVPSFPITVQPQSSVTLNVRYSPDSVGDHSGKICVRSNDPDEDPYCCDLTGNGIDSPQILSMVPSRACLGSQVTILGTSFGSQNGTSSIKFNSWGPDAVILDWEQTQIVCTVPEGALPGCVTVNTDMGSSNCWDFDTSCPQSISLTKTGQNTSYGQGDDGAVQAGVEWPNPRFTDNGDGTVTDNLTGLMWLKDGNCFGEMDWDSTMNIVADFNLNSASYGCEGYSAAYRDWMMPNVNELESLNNEGVTNCGTWMNSQGFAKVLETQGLSYWTSTTWAKDSNAAWIAGMVYGNLGTRQKSSEAGSYVWAVRSDSHNIWKTGQTESYAALDDGQLQKGVGWPRWPETRFIENSDGTVTDSLTGLIWLLDANCLGGTISWSSALNKVNDFNVNSGNYSCSGYTGNYSNWRLPNRKELRSMIDYSRSNVALPEGHLFINIELAEAYWTSTTWAHYPSEAWLIYFEEGTLASHLKTNSRHVWPVRNNAPGGLCGDVNKNERLDIGDAMYIAQFIVGNRDDTTMNFDVLDTNANGRTDIGDAMYIAQFIVGNRDCLCAGAGMEFCGQ